MGASEYKLSIQPGYLLVEHPHNYEIVRGEESARLTEISAACSEAGCRKVLIRGPRTKVRLSVAEIFRLGEEIAKLNLMIAIVELHDALEGDEKFLENVVSTRGSPLRFFDNEQDAKDWLGIP